MSSIAIAAIVASVNLVAYRYMLSDDNQAIVQLLSGWGRIYKPILHDEINPRSWSSVRPGRAMPSTHSKPANCSGRRVFNHGVSGGTAYETRRFADSALDNPKLRAAIINLNTFYRDDSGARFRYGFDESILNVDAEHHANHFVGLRRAYSLALGGWAVGANIKLISTILARDRGVTRPDYLESYEQGDLTRRNLKPIRKRIFPKRGKPSDVPPEDAVAKQVIANEAELGVMIDGFCAKNVDVYAYFTPTHTRQQTCDPRASEEMAALEFLRRKQQSCGSRIHYFNFAYANAMTLEGVLQPVKASLYYRPDGHPRPTAGLVMAATMFAKPYPSDTLPSLQQDFGVELLSHADAEGWLLQRAARCHGDWGDAGFDKIKRALSKP